jgi:hypothetical protein
MYKMFRLHYAILLLLPLANANYKLLQQRRLDESYPPFQLTKGRCKKPIQTAVACANAVFKLAWHNTSALQIKELSWGPKGCFFYSTTNSVYFNTAAEGSYDCSNSLILCGCEHCDDTCVKAGGEVSTPSGGEVSTCVDTPGWRTRLTIYDTDGPTQEKKTMTCEQMSAGVSPHCKEGKVMFPDRHVLNQPEKNCCACGKDSDEKDGDCIDGLGRDVAGNCKMSTLRVVLWCYGFLCLCFCLFACLQRSSFSFHKLGIRL